MPVKTYKKNDNDSGARVKLRWMELDVEGGTSDLIEGFKSFVTALTRGTPVTAPAPTLAGAKPATITSTAVIETPVPKEENSHAVEAETADEPSLQASNGNGAERPKRRRAPKAPKFLNDLDLTKTPIQLAGFLQEKNPNGDMDKFAVVAVWFKQHFNTEEVTIDHFYTAYKALGWQAKLPDDPNQTLRNLKNNKNWFDSGSKRGAYRVNWHGESAVNKMGAAKP